MATQTEEVEVKFTADTAEYNEEVEKSAKTTNNFATSVGSVATFAIGAGAALLKVNAVMKIFNIQTLLGIQNITLFNITFLGLAKTIWRNVIPAFVKLRAAIISTGIGALVIALISLIAALNNTVTGSDFLSTAWKALGNIMQGVLDIVTGFGKAIVGLVSGDWELATNGLAQAWDGVSNGIGNAIGNASRFVIIQRAIENNNKTLALQAAQRQVAIDGYNKALAVQGQSVETYTEILRLRAKEEQGLINDQKTSLILGKNALTQEQASGVSSARNLEIEKERNDIEAELLGLRVQSQNVENQRQIDVQIAITAESDAKTEAAELEEQQRIDRINAHNQEILDRIETDALAFEILRQQQEDAQVQREALRDKDLQDFEEGLAAEVAAEEKAQKEKDKIKLEAQKLEESQLENFENFKGAALNQGFALAGQLADENQQVQGAIMIAQAVAATAVGIASAPKDYGPAAPIAIPIIAALGAAQVAVIAKNMGTTGDSNVETPSLSVPTTTDEVQTESAFNVRQPQAQVVLVTEDLDRVQNRVTVTNDRSSLG